MEVRIESDGPDKNRHDELNFKNNTRYNPKFTILKTIGINTANLKIL